MANVKTMQARVFMGTVLRMYDNGSSIQEIADELNQSIDSIESILRMFSRIKRES